MAMDTCPHAWLRLCEEVYRATSRWVADHPDAAATDLEHLLTTSYNTNHRFPVVVRLPSTLRQ
jgi:hypothetical protein